MKTPTWATVIGVIMIVFGGCGAMNDIRSITMPEKLAEGRIKLEKKKAEEQAIKADTTQFVRVDTLGSESPDTLTAKGETEDEEVEEIPFFGKMSEEQILTLSEFSTTWIVRFGYIGATISFIYLLGGVFLLKRKTFSIKLAYGALVLSILCAGAQTALLTSNASGDFIAKMTGLSQLPGILIDIILLAVIFASDKDAYKEENLSS